MFVSLAALELRLKDGAHRCEGRVEVKLQGEWGTVDDDGWGLKGAAVVCRQLGCGVAVEAPRGAYFGPPAGPIWFFYVLCTGTESALTECRYSSIRDFGNYGLFHDWDAGAVCSDESCLVWVWVPSRKSFGLIPRITMWEYGSQPLESTWVKTPVPRDS